MIRDLPFYKFVAAGCIITSIFLLLIPNYNWEHSESWFFFYKCLDRYEEHGFLKGVVNLCLDGWTPRPRILSWFSFVVNSEIRKFAFDFIPYHASFSFTWVLSIGVLPFIFYKSLKKIGIQKDIALMSVGFYFCTVGHLSTHLMYFHQAKPMTTFFMILSFYISLSVYEKVFYFENKFKDHFLIILTLFMGTMWDELFFFVFPFIILLNPYALKSRNTVRNLVRDYIIVIVIFFVVITFGLPWLFENFGDRDFDFWGYAVKNNNGLSSIKLKNILFNFKAMTFNHFAPIANVNLVGREPWYFWLPIAGLVGLFLNSSQDKKKILISLSVIILFVLFQSIILSRRDGVLFLGSFYWGHLYSVFATILLAFGLSSIKIKHKKIFTALFFILISYVNVKNSLMLNKNHENVNIYQISSEYGIRSHNPPMLTFMKENNGNLTWGQVIDVWRKRDDFKEAFNELKNVPKNGYWIYMHLYRAHNDLIDKDNKLWGLEKTYWSEKK